MIDAKRWATFSLFEQWGHIGSEIARASLWRDRHDILSSNRCIERAIELIDLSLLDQRWRGRLKEMCRFREVLADIYAQTHVYKVSLMDLNKYCAGFAIAARKDC